MKICVVFVLVLFANLAQAKIIFHQESGRAVMFRMSGDRVEAFACAHVRENDFSPRMIGKTHSKRCQTLIPGGFAAKAIACNMEEFKGNANAAIEHFQKSLFDSLDALAKTEDAEELKVRQEARRSVMALADQQRVAIQSVSAEDVFTMFTEDAREQKIETVGDVREIESVIADVSALTLKKKGCPQE